MRVLRVPPRAAGGSGRLRALRRRARHAPLRADEDAGGVHPSPRTDFQRRGRTPPGRVRAAHVLPVQPARTTHRPARRHRRLREQRNAAGGHELRRHRHRAGDQRGPPPTQAPGRPRLLAGHRERGVAVRTRSRGHHPAGGRSSKTPPTHRPSRRSSPTSRTPATSWYSDLRARSAKRPRPACATHWSGAWKPSSN